MADDQSQVPPPNGHSDSRFVPKSPALARHPAAKPVPTAAPTNTTPAVLKLSAPKVITKPTTKTKKPNPTLARNLSSALDNADLAATAAAAAAAAEADPDTTPTRELPKLFDLNSQRLLFRPASLLDDKKRQLRMDEAELLFPNWRWMSNRRDVDYYEEWKPWEEKWEAIWEEFESDRKAKGVDVFGNQKALFGEGVVRYHGDLRQQLAARLASLTGRGETQGGERADGDVGGP